MSQPSSAGKGRFQWSCDRIIGSGSAAVVYSGICVDPNGIQRQIAVKRAPNEHSFSLRRESKIYKDFKGCPEIITCFAAAQTFEDDEFFYSLLLEFAPAGTLATLIAKSGGSGLPEIEARVYTKMILKGLARIHKKRYVHCDIKPENILAFPLDHSACKYEVKIGDFGLSVIPGEWEWTGGTFDYMSPESLRKENVVSGFDVWALGCTLVEMISGKRPWEGRISEYANMNEYAKVVENELPPIPKEMSECGKDFLMNCFIRNQRKRWTARMLLEHPYISGLGSEN